MDLKEAEILGEAVAGHWYYRSKAAALARLLGARRFRGVLDVGAGSGFFSRALLERGAAESATCVDTSYPAEWSETVAGRTLHRRTGVVRSDADLLLFMDVLEHVDDDVGLLRDYAKTVAPGTTAIVSVPAFQLLWSGHDEFLGHKRRYTLGLLRERVRAAGFSVERCCYYFGLVLPIAAAMRLAGSLRRARPQSQLKMHGAAVNRALGGLCALELPFFMHNRVAGLTVFCECRTGD